MEDLILQIIREKFKESTDIRYREIKLPQGIITLVFLEAISEKQDISEYIIRPLIKADKTVETLQDMMDRVITASVMEKQTALDKIFARLLSGFVIITCDFEKGAICCDMAKFSSRNIAKPDTDPVIKGPQEGFNEFLKDNLSLIRKRIHNENLVIEEFQVGSSSKTSVMVVYLKESAPQKLINQVRSKIENLKIDFILETNYIGEEFQAKYTLFETVGNYEKPDIICSMLFEGRVAIMVEGSPSVAVLPTFFIETFTSADDYYTNRFVAAGLRLFRYLSFLLTVLLPAFYLALTVYHHSLIPSVFLFKLASTRAGVPFPTVIEILLMLFFFELSREAGRRLPQSIGKTLSLVSTLILGETAVTAGMASGGTIVIIGVYAITSLINPKLIGPAIALTITNVLFAAFFGLHGFLIFFILIIAHIASLESCGYPYMFPLGSTQRINYPSSDFFLRGKLKDLSYKSLKGTDKE